MNRIEDALRALPETVDVTLRGDLATSVRRLHARRAVRRRSGIAAVTVGATALAAVPGVAISRSIGRNTGSTDTASAWAGVQFTRASLDARLASLATGPGADQPRATAGFAYVRTRAMWTAGLNVGSASSGGGGATVPDAELMPAREGSAVTVEEGTSVVEPARKRGHEVGGKTLGSGGAPADDSAPEPASGAVKADVGAQEPKPPVPTANDSHSGEGVVYGDARVREIWLDAANQGHLISKPLKPVFFNPGDEAKLAASGVPLGELMDLALRNDNERPAELPSGDPATELKFGNPSFVASQLPTEPAAMLGVLRTVAGQHKDRDAVFAAGRDLLRETVLPLNVRIAIYRAMLLLPEVAVANGVADYDGRIGVGIGQVNPALGMLEQIIVDPATGSQLGERDSLTVANSLGPVGTVVGHTAIQQAAFVPNLKDRPKK